MNYFNFDFLGCSGIGKTTFSRHLKTTNSNNFFFREDLKEKISKQKIKNTTLIKLNEIKKENVRKMNYSSNLESFMLNYYENIIKYEELCLEKKEYYPLINDDGFAHNFFNEIEKINYSERKGLEKLFSNKKIIHFISSEDNIYRNLIERNKKTPGAANDWITQAKKQNIEIESLIHRFINESQRILKITQELGAQSITIDLRKDSMQNIKIASDFIKSNQVNIQPITKEKFFDAAKKHPSPHWRTQPLENRWTYHSLALSILETLSLTSPDQVLELGTVGIQLIPGSDTMDIDGYWEYEGKSPTYLHNARDLPWPVRSSYQAIVALRVFQYLGNCQKKGFLEAKRLTKNLIIVVPRGMEYIPKGLEDTKGITYEEFLLWNDGIPPKKFIATDLGDFYHWEF